MINLTAEDQASLEQNVGTWAVCWWLRDKRGREHRQTSLDTDIEVSRGTVAGIDLDGLYESMAGIQSTTIHQSADLSVDNLDVDALLDEFGLDVDSIRAGMFDGIEYMIFVVNWKSPTNSGIVVKRGIIGNIKSFAREVATMELRGLTQYLQKNILEQTSTTCRNELGDARCKVDLSIYTVTGIVDAVESRRKFEATLDPISPEPQPGYFNDGILTFTSGENEGFSKRVRTDSAGSAPVLGTFALYESFPGDIMDGDTFTVSAGCNKQHVVTDGVVTGDCFNKFDNLLNNESEPFVPGQYAIYAGPK